MDKEQIQNLIKDLIEKTMVKLDKLTVSEEIGDNTWYSAEVTEPHFFIDREGEALHALNHLVRRIIENKSLSNTKNEGGALQSQATVGTNNILIDVNGFQKKKVESIRAIAHMMGERARYFKSNVEIDPMGAFERRIVHEFLANATDLKTESAGIGPTRRVVVKYIGEI